MNKRDAMLTLQEIKATVGQFHKIDYQNFTREDLSRVASRLNWEISLSRGGGCIIECKYPSTKGSWAFGHSQSEDCHQLEWFVIPLHLWTDFDREDFETIEAYQLWRQEYDNYYEMVRKELISILGKPAFSAVRPPKNYEQVAWRLTNGVMYLYQGERDIQFGIEVGLFFEPWSYENPIRELRF